MVIKPISYYTRKSNLKVGSCYKLHIIVEDPIYFYKDDNKPIAVKDGQIVILVDIKYEHSNQVLFKFLSNHNMITYRSNTTIFAFLCEFEELNE